MIERRLNISKNVVDPSFKIPHRGAVDQFFARYFYMIKAKMRNNFFKIRKARGMSVLIVSQYRRASLISKAKKRQSIVDKDYLKYYLVEDNIRHYLGIKKRKLFS